MIVNLIYITLIVVFIVDVSGWTESWKGALRRAVQVKTGYRIDTLRPFDCSLCLTFWAGLVYCLVTDCIGLQSIAAVCGCALSTRVVASAMRVCVELVQVAIDGIYKLIEIWQKRLN